MIDEDYTKVDSPPNPYMGLKKVKNKKTKKTKIFMTTPIQPVQTEQMMNGGVPAGYMIGSPLAKAKTKRYFPNT